MSDFDSPEGSFETQVVGVIKELLERLRITEEEAEVVLSFGNGSFVTVTPVNPEAAPIHLHFYSDGGLIDFSFGNSLSMFELDGENYMRRLRVLAKAVIEGECGETRGFITRTSWLEPIEEGGRVRSSSLFYPRLWRIKRKFAPYSA